MTEYRVEALTDLTIFTTPAGRRKPVQFTAGWTRTLNELRHELRHLKGRDVIFEVAVTAGDLRRDGMLRANAKVAHPGVRLSFDSVHGPMSFICDTYESRWADQMPSWQANVRAIVKTLEALRAVDRHGATQGEQYAGFKALGPGMGSIALGGMTRTAAAAVLSRWSGVPIDADESEQSARARWREARAATHPDRRGGDRTAWDEVEAAAKVLGLS